MVNKNTICLGYGGTVLEAVKSYAATFPNSKVGEIHYAPGDYWDGKEGDVLVVEFAVFGIPRIGLGGGTEIKHSEALSFQRVTEDQAETDRLWNAIVNNGVEESVCGWCKDQSGQITPRVLSSALGPLIARWRSARSARWWI